MSISHQKKPWLALDMVVVVVVVPALAQREERERAQLLRLVSVVA